MNEIMIQANHPAFGMLDGTVSQDERLADFLEVVPFAIDLGEYLCFVSSRRQQQEVGWTPDPADTRRALIFVSGWIVRWEIFDRGYPLDRWNEHVEGLQPPTLGNGDQTEILSVEALMTNEIPGYPARCHLYVWLANVPDSARGPWGNWLPQGLVDAAAELQENVRFNQVQLYLTGQVKLVCDLGFEAEVLAKVIRRGIEITDQRYRDWEADGIRRRQELARIQAEFAHVIDSAQTDHVLFGAVEVTERGSDGQPVVWVSLNFGESKFEELGRTHRSRLPRRWRGSRGRGDASESRRIRCVRAHTPDRGGAARRNRPVRRNRSSPAIALWEAPTRIPALPKAPSVAIPSQRIRGLTLAPWSFPVAATMRDKS